MRRLITFIFMGAIKIFASIFYKIEVQWVNEVDFERVRLIAILNHTSLYEPLYIGAVPWKFVWRLSAKMVGPGADKTLKRPIVGIFWKLFGGPGLVSITRKRDHSWSHFMKAASQNDSIITIAPEGRMKRKDGLDKDGKPMTIRSGITDIIEHLNEGVMVIAYSGGLHHVQAPGEFMPRIFKKLILKIEAIEIKDYKEQFKDLEAIGLKKAIVADFQRRLDNDCPKAY